MRRVFLALWERATRKKFDWMFVTVKILPVCSLLTRCISLNKKYSLEENRSDLQVRGSAKMGFEPKCGNLEARLPFLACQMCGEGNYHHPRRRSDSGGERGRGQFMAGIFMPIPGPPRAADRRSSFSPVAQWLQIPVSACVPLVNL